MVGCRQPNPEWEGPDGGDGTTTGTEPTAGQSMDVTTVTTAPVDPSTEGDNCQNENQCPDGWVCGPMGCQRGEDGDPCDADGDCQAPTGVCGPEGTCQAGAAGDPCSENGHCGMEASICGPNQTCQAGVAGDPCGEPGHCADGLMCTDGVCA